MNNRELVALQIQKHGKDRYPTVQSQLIKLVEEVGELAKEINAGDYEKTRLEAADVALALYNLAFKCAFDLDDAIQSVVRADVRKFD